MIESSKTRDFLPACPESILRVCNEFESPFLENTVWLNWYDLSPFGARWNTPDVTLSTKNAKSELPLGDSADPVRITWTYTAVPGQRPEMFRQRIFMTQKGFLPMNGTDADIIWPVTLFGPCPAGKNDPSIHVLLYALVIGRGFALHNSQSRPSCHASGGLYRMNCPVVGSPY